MHSGFIYVCMYACIIILACAITYIYKIKQNMSSNDEQIVLGLGSIAILKKTAIYWSFYKSMLGVLIFFTDLVMQVPGFGLK